jgi:hypothetical protein
MRLADPAFVIGLLASGLGAWGCGAHNGHGPGGVGTVGGGGGTEIPDDAQASSGATGTSGATGSSGNAHEAGAGGSSSGGSTGSSTSGTGSSGGSGSSSGASSGTNASGSSAGASSGSEIADAGDAGDAGTGGLQLSIGGPLHLVSLDWAVTGPNTYKGSVQFGDAQSVEWVVGGILQGSGYTLSVTAKDDAGDPCDGTSAPFSVSPGTTTYTILTIVCHTPSADPADVTTGSVAVDASVSLVD